MRFFHSCRRMLTTRACADRPVSPISGFLIDLDGTMYTPTGMVPGADSFLRFLRSRKIPHVFCSNTGAKGWQGVQSRLVDVGITPAEDEPVSHRHIYTAAEAQVQYMVDHIQPGSRVFVFAGGNAATMETSFWMKLLKARDPELVKTWDVRTFLTEAEAKEWGEVAATARAAGNSVSMPHVCIFSDGSISSVPDPCTGELGFADWSFDVIKKAGYLLSHGAPLVCTAEDSFNMRADGWPLPGPGMITSMFRTLLYPLDKNIIICGKGGAVGNQYMMDHAIAMLCEQGHSGRREEILMVGDRFDTDMRAGTRSGIRTCLVESGCHSLDLAPHYPTDRVDYVVSSVAELRSEHSS